MSSPVHNVTVYTGKTCLFYNDNGLADIYFAANVNHSLLSAKMTVFYQLLLYLVIKTENILPCNIDNYRVWP